MHEEKATIFFSENKTTEKPQAVAIFIVCCRTLQNTPKLDAITSHRNNNTDDDEDDNKIDVKGKKHKTKKVSRRKKCGNNNNNHNRHGDGEPR